MMKKPKKEFPVLYPNAAGIDISSKEHFVAVNPAVVEQPVRAFGAFTEDLDDIALWLKECKVDTVAMEATGIYWVNLYLVLEAAGFEVVLVNARHVKNVRGKKTDMKDAEWIRQLHSCGLLSASFQPDGYTRTLRAYMRHRKNLTSMAASHIHMMQKAMEQMNIKLQHVISDVTGKSGQSIIRAIIQGEREASVLAQLVDRRVKASTQDIEKSLNAIWKDEHLFELEQAYELYICYQEKIQTCDMRIKGHLEERLVALAKPEKETKKRKQSNKNNLNFDAAVMLRQIIGTDLTEIFGITDTNALEIISEIGWDMGKWPTAKHFTSWLNLSPNNKISGGRVLSSRTGKKKNKAGQVFRLAAFAIQRSNHWLARFYHRIKARAGTPKAIVATARKIALIFYKMVKEKVPFNPVNLEQYSEVFKNQQINRLQRQAAKMGLRVVPDLVT